MNRCIICEAPPKRGRPLYRVNAREVDGRPIPPAWVCLKHYLGTKLRKPIGGARRRLISLRAAAWFLPASGSRFERQ